MATKFWMNRDGVVGTAHRNREDQVVDFRPAEKSVKLEFRVGKRVIVLPPPKGVEIDPLVMPARMAKREVVAEEVCFTMFRETWDIEFEGVRFSSTAEVKEAKHTPEAVAFREAAEAKRKSESEANKRQRAFVTEKMSALTAIILVAVAQPTAREWGKLESANWRLALADLLARARVAFEVQEVPAEFVANSTPRWSLADEKAWEESVRQELLEIRADEKARRKAEFAGR